MEQPEKIVRPGSRPEPRDQQPLSADTHDDGAYVGIDHVQKRRNIPLPVVVLALVLLALGAGAYVALSRLHSAQEQQSSAVAAPVIPLPEPEEPSLVSETTSSALVPKVQPEPVPQSAPAPVGSAPPAPVSQAKSPVVPVQEAPPAPIQRPMPALPRGLQGVVQPQDWRAVKPALAFAFSQGEDDTPVDWVNDRNGHSGMVVQSGTGVDEDGCRQFRVIDDADPDNRGYVDVCRTNDW